MLKKHFIISDDGYRIFFQAKYRQYHWLKSKVLYILFLQIKRLYCVSWRKNSVSAFSYPINLIVAYLLKENKPQLLQLSKIEAGKFLSSSCLIFGLN